VLILSQSIYKHGCHRQFLFLFGRFLKIFSSETIMPNRATYITGSIYGRTSMRFSLFFLEFFFQSVHLDGSLKKLLFFSLKGGLKGAQVPKFTYLKGIIFNVLLFFFGKMLICLSFLLVTKENKFDAVFLMNWLWQELHVAIPVHHLYQLWFIEINLFAVKLVLYCLPFGCTEGFCHWWWYYL